LAVRIAPTLDEAADSGSGRRRTRNAPIDSLARRNALDGLWNLDSSAEQRFDRLTEFARRSFHTAVAKITIVEGDRFWTKSSYGEAPTEGPRSDSICFTAIECEDSLVVADASRDPRFAEMDVVKGPPPVRFYAGHRIEAPNGVPIGVLCVQDSVARDITGFDRALLRDIALLVQKELWVGEQAVGFERRRPLRASTPIERTFAPASR
jgi:GAF domain-containing protein